MNPLARYKPSKLSNHPCPDLMTMAERELSAFFNAVTQLFGTEAGGDLRRRLAAGVDRDRWSARFNPRMAIDHCEGFDSARKSSERFVSIDRTTNCLGGKEYACFCYRCYRFYRFCHSS